MPRIKDLTGNKYNKLFVIEITEKRDNSGSVYWRCKCDCGNIVDVVGISLKNNNTKSCGCLVYEQNAEMLKNRQYRKFLLSDMTDEEKIQWLQDKHWKEELPLNTMAKIADCHRITITRLFKKYNLKYRTISEDNKRRFKNTSDEEKKNYTKKANKKMRELMNDEDYKKQHFRKVALSQNTKGSKLEKQVEEYLKELSIEYEPQKKIHRYKIDFYLKKYNLCIEVHGDYWHNIHSVKERDKRKAKYLKENKFKLLVIWGKEINSEKFNKEYLKKLIEAE